MEAAYAASRCGDTPHQAVRAMLIEELLPAHDAIRREHPVVGGAVETVYEAVWRADFVRAWRESAAVRSLFAARSAAQRIVADMTYRGDWLLLGADSKRG